MGINDDENKTLVYKLSDIEIMNFDMGLEKYKEIDDGKFWEYLKINNLVRNNPVVAFAKVQISYALDKDDFLSKLMDNFNLKYSIGEWNPYLNEVYEGVGMIAGNANYCFFSEPFYPAFQIPQDGFKIAGVYYGDKSQKKDMVLMFSGDNFSNDIIDRTLDVFLNKMNFSQISFTREEKQIFNNNYSGIIGSQGHHGLINSKLITENLDGGFFKELEMDDSY